jgi:hypothetical protein
VALLLVALLLVPLLRLAVMLTRQLLLLVPVATLAAAHLAG